MHAREGNARAIGLAGWNVGLRRSLESAQTQNGGRHCCRPPVAGLRSAWRFRRIARAFWFRRHAPPAPRTASGFAFGHRGRARYPCGPQRRELRRRARRSGRNPIASPWPLPPDQPSARCRAARIQPSRPTSFRIAGTGKDAWNTIPCRSARPSLARRRASLRGPTFRQHPGRFPCGTFPRYWHK